MAAILCYLQCYRSGCNDISYFYVLNWFNSQGFVVSGELRSFPLSTFNLGQFQSEEATRKHGFLTEIPEMTT